jgi:hydroxymethylbilane synthase
MTVVRIATRGSALALWQARQTAAQLEQRGARCELVIIETQGDRELGPFALLTGQGFFTKAVQDALLDGRADVAVHCLKDLPSAPMTGLVVAAIPTRADARDLLLWRDSHRDATRPLGLKAGTKIGTSAVRRRDQLISLDAALVVQELRGNVPTRIEKLRDGHYDAILIAAAGVARLQLELDGLHTRRLEQHEFVAAPGQGALALECREDDRRCRELLAGLDDPHTRNTVMAERGLMAMLHGGCQLALGAAAQHVEQGISLRWWFGGSSGVVVGRDAADAAAAAFRALSSVRP